MAKKDKVGDFNFGFNALPKKKGGKAKKRKGTKRKKKGGPNAWQSYTGGA